MRPKKPLLAALAAVALLAGPGLAVNAAAAFVPSAVTIKVDDARKTINVNVKLAFYNRSCGSASCAVPAADVARIVRAIETMWNNGSKVKCYTFVVKVEARTVGGQSEAGQNEVDIGLDYGPNPVRAFVHGTLAGGGDTPDPLSNAEDQRVEATHDVDEPTTWPSNTYDQTYAHEFGHILGLADNYDRNKVGFPLPGASDDLMFRKQGTVTNEMVTRVVERSGKVKLNDLKCGFATESTVAPIEWHGVHCDSTDTEWLVQGVTKTSGYDETWLYRAVIDTVTHKGTYKYEAIGSIASGTLTKNGAGTASTTAQADGSVLLNLDETSVRGVITAAGTTQTVTLPVAATAFTWTTATARQCP